MIKLKEYLLLLLVIFVASACNVGGSDEQADKLRMPSYDSLRVGLRDSSKVKDSIEDKVSNKNKIQESLNSKSQGLGRHKSSSDSNKSIGKLEENTMHSLGKIESSVSKKPKLLVSSNSSPNRSKDSFVDKTELLKKKGLTLEKLREMGFLYVKLNTENLKSVHDMYDSGYMDTLAYEKTKLSIEKNLRIIRLLNKLSLEKGLQDEKFSLIYLDQFVGIVREGLITSQEVLQYLQRIYDTHKVSQHKYIVSAKNLRVNVDLMWAIIREVDF